MMIENRSDRPARDQDAAGRTESPPLSWHQLSGEAAVERLQTHPEHGLDESEAARRLVERGPNELLEQGRKSAWQVLAEQFRSLMVAILLVASALSALVGDDLDALVILAILVINTVLGFTQEYRAERALAALKRLAVPTVRVRRGGTPREISARDLVPGDLVLLEAGNLVPADGRVLESANLRVEEAALTGESQPVEKGTAALSTADVALADRNNMVYLGTVVAYGRGLVAVTETGMQTRLGQIAAMLHTVEREATPLQRRLDQLGRGLALAALAVVGVIFALGLLRGEPLQLLLLTAISMAVAAVPEGLPAVVTVALALGAQRMLRRRALVRRLSAVETLGSVTTICSDKTGTLTENRMRVSVLEVAGSRLDLTDSSAFSGPGTSDSPGLAEQPTIALLLFGSALASDAVLEPADLQTAGSRALGDPTEGALLQAAARFGLDKAALEQAFPRIDEVPFDTARKRMTTLHRCPASATQWPASLGLPQPWYSSEATQVAFSKGAVDSLLGVCCAVWADGAAQPLDAAWRERIAAAHDRLARDGVRVLGLAFRPLPAPPAESAAEAEELERELIFVGLVGMIDPPRPEVAEAVRVAQRAGVRPLMITGDHPLTAQAIARAVGIATNGRVLTSVELDRLSADELVEQVADVPVYARVSPEHKLAIVEALRRRGELVAMTGDGVNDAPALKKADIGVAMGITGTDVSKEAADMVLLDDNFATIVAAIEQGRVIYDNIRKFVKFMLTTNSAELAVMLFAPLLGMPLPLLPLQILWINLVTDGLPALALGFEPAERGTMRRPPHRPDESIFGRGLGRHVVWVGLLMAVVSLGPALWYWLAGQAAWQTLAFTTLVFAQMAHVLAIRSGQDSLFRSGLRSNPPLLAAVLLTLGAQLAVMYLPALREVFDTVPLSAAELALSAALASLVFWAVELEKWLARHRAPESPIASPPPPRGAA